MILGKSAELSNLPERARTRVCLFMPAEDSIARSTLTGFIGAFQYHKNLADRAIAQVTDANLHVTLDANTNSIAVIMKHVAGNLRSRWTDFLTTDGEKPWRNRDQEFIDSCSSRTELLDDWESGWSCLVDSLHALTADDLGRTVAIRGERMSVPMAACRSLGHTAYHVGQIVLIARHLAGDSWTTLTIPRGGSQQHNKRTWGTSQYAPGA
jgi:hypothetical protein